MKNALQLFAVLTFAGTLFAADPIEGTWNLNVAKSKSSPNRPLPKAVTGVVVAKGDQFEVTATGTDGEGKPVSVKYDIPSKGGPVSYLEGAPPAGTSVVSKRLDTYTSDSTTTRDGKQVQTIHTVISRDGKTMRRTIKGEDAKGKPFSSTEVYEKQ